MSLKIYLFLGVSVIACYSPLKAFYRINKETGKKDICFAHYKGEQQCYDDKGNYYPFKIDIPCGQCVGCRLEYSRQWAIRCVLESMQHEHNYFITLTYDPEHLPVKSDNVSVNYETGEFLGTFSSSPLVPEHLTKFMKDLRRYFEYHYGHTGIRFFACGEYGEQFMRPHYHIILFNCPIPDLDFLKTSFNGDVYWNSDILSDIWKKGFVLVANCNYSTCSYVARYMMKKWKGLNSCYYDKLGLIPPFIRSSRNPGIAKEYYDAESDKIYEYDSLVITNSKGVAQKVKPPKYFDRLYDIDNPEDLKRIKDIRTELAVKGTRQKLKCTSLTQDEYLAVCERNKEASANKLLRPLE